MRALENASPTVGAEIGAIYATCYSSVDFADLYRNWQAETAGPLEKLSRPKLAVQLAEIEQEVEAVTKKSDNQLELSKLFSLVALLREPPRHLQWCHDQLRQILSETADDHPDRSSLPTALAAMVAAGAVPPQLHIQPQPMAAAVVERAAPSVSTLGVSSSQVLDSTLMRKVSEADEQLILERFRFRALQTELDIFRDANAQLVLYAKALEEEVLQRRPPSGGAGDSPAKLLSIHGLQQWEDEMLEMARENAELKARLKLMEVYRAQATLLAPDDATNSSDSSEMPGEASAKRAPPPR
jgi:hypothetical protein